MRRMHCSQFQFQLQLEENQAKQQPQTQTPEESSHKIRDGLAFVWAPLFFSSSLICSSSCCFFPGFRSVVRCVIRYILLFNPRPFVCARDLCTTFVPLKGERHAKAEGTHHPVRLADSLRMRH